MFPSAFAELGQVAQGEMYGLFPALAAGGDNIAENLKKVSAPEYHSSVNHLDPLKYHDWDFDGPAGARVIGKAAQSAIPIILRMAELEGATHLRDVHRSTSMAASTPDPARFRLLKSCGI
ncbi:T6SS immunity protein Tdi1 domain-containing protein [Rhizobium deserti]|uniref:T6SS immunity protein Tdi1 domain-containing protein n=1 Tax=Rhizobium deserti TaxID=2547961 RepID=UPI0026A6B184